MRKSHLNITLVRLATKLRSVAMVALTLASFIALWLLATSVFAQVTPFDPENIIFHYHGSEDDSKLGSKLRSMGDINSDGFDDIAMSSYNPRGVYVFYGGNPVDSFPDMFLRGYKAADPIDLDGDGVDDIITSSVEDFIGTICFFKGYGDSLASVPYDSLKPQTDNYEFGSWVVTGYVDDDEFGDLLTGKRTVPGGPIFYYYSGCPTLDTVADWTYAIENYSHTCTELGFIDFNGDGNLDIFIGLHAYNDSFSYVYIFLGPDFGAEPDIIIGHPAEFDPYPGTVDRFADHVANVGDVDSDGYDELAVVYYETAFLYSTGPDADTLWDYFLSEPAHVTAAAGDVNGDGVGDLVTGGGFTMDGNASLYLGGTPFDNMWNMVILRSNLPPLFLYLIGYQVSSAGDFNGDGYDDFMFACQNFAGGNHGDVFVVQGGDYLQTDIMQPANEPLPTDFNLEQNYPNPFNPVTDILFGLPEARHVKIEIFNVLGQRVKTLADRTFAAGYHSIQWAGDSDAGEKLSSGVYLYRIQAGENVETKKMLLLK